MKAVLKTKCGCAKAVKVPIDSRTWLVPLKEEHKSIKYIFDSMTMSEFTLADEPKMREFRRTGKTELIMGKEHVVFEEI